MTGYNFVVNGRQYTPVPKDSAIADGFKPGCYVIKHRMNGPDYFEPVTNVNIPKKIYGDCTRYANRIWKQFKESNENVGVLLSGERGSGKTLLSKVISNMAMQEGMSTILVNDPETGSRFGELMQMIPPSVVILDEFEKIYEKDDQMKMLTVLDGVLSNRHLFIITVNDYSMLDDHLLNRPGRIRYRIKYNGLSESEIREYCNEVLIDKGQIEGILMLTSMFHKFNFDMLRVLVEEMNKYGETAIEAVQILNIDPSHSERLFEYRVFINDIEIDTNLYYSYGIGRQNPMSQDCDDSNLHIRYGLQAIKVGSKIVQTNSDQETTLYQLLANSTPNINQKYSSDVGYENAISKENLVSHNHIDGKYVYVIKDGNLNVKIVFTRESRKNDFNYYAF
jgi:hypothetical protein